MRHCSFYCLPKRALYWCLQACFFTKPTLRNPSAFGNGLFRTTSKTKGASSSWLPTVLLSSSWCSLAHKGTQENGLKYYIKFCPNVLSFTINKSVHFYLSLVLCTGSSIWVCFFMDYRIAYESNLWNLFHKSCALIMEHQIFDVINWCNKNIMLKNDTGFNKLAWPSGLLLRKSFLGSFLRRICTLQWTDNVVINANHWIILLHNKHPWYLQCPIHDIINREFN